ncbi:unnamed protein product [Rotaria magnacalcarata]|uniref:Uncharacterized protein n=2 Tax=Rotaria magnacalcarata TaxID=392030 RepID=A0A816KFW3_9BILA|nr:unnamed protein product [Rotaria magnacalcarata]CAF1445175.1 unnamed protein product [Rotaria magnacalcarata]CAF1917959.1 unnamed protein product [Rotaria magnacalcarata]CAF1986564.1 unnamed protein product [Rotaria magnacalcarata]CAF4431987.1 unnamed protein product [Rotaria magnacalcarata]
MAFKSDKQLVEAVEQCQLNKIINLIKHGYNIHVRNTLGKNFLMFILQQQDPLLAKKRIQIFRYLIEKHNLDIHLFDNHHKNVFNWATHLNCTEEALYLLNSYPGDINILERDQSGSCSIHYAVEHGNEILVHAIVNYLVRYRIRFDIKDSHNNTPEELAKKLGYNKIFNFLSQACRSTVFMSREIPVQKERPKTNKSKSSINSNRSARMSFSSSLVVDSSENFNLLETKINAAKQSDDWKTVATLRTFKKNKIEAKSNNTLNSIPETNTNTLSLRPLRKPSPSDHIKQSFTQPEQMLQLMEPQISLSYRRPFIPMYPRLINMNPAFQRSGCAQRKMSHASSRRMSSVSSFRKRDSEISQISTATLQDIQMRYSLPAIYKSHRQSIVTTN